MNKGRKKRYCIAFGCLNTNKIYNPNMSFFTLPKDPERRKEWLTILGREDLLNKKDLKHYSYEVCVAHFKDSAIKTINHLQANAVPVRCTCSESQNNSSALSKQLESKAPILPKIVIQNSTTVSTETQTKTQPSVEETTQKTKDLPKKSLRNKKLSEKLKDSKSKCRRLQYELDRIKKELKPTNTPITSDAEGDINKRFQKLIEWQNKLRTNFKGNRYDAEYKVFALNLHYSSPHTFRCLQSVLKLPSRRTLYRFKVKIPLKLDDRVLKNISMKIKSLPVDAKYCSICIDEMVLKPNLYYDIKTDDLVGFQNVNGNITPEIATNAYVIMLQGIYCNWNKPIAYAFLASTEHYKELDVWINEVITKLLSLGIEVKAVISDQESNLVKYAKEIKKVTVEDPYFFVDGRKIYYIFDVPHLLKCVRNNLLSSNFYFNGKIISWKYIKELYDNQKQTKMRLIPKVTYAHVYPNEVKKMCVKYAAQIFSRTVYAALETYIDFGKISEDARATAKFIKTINDLFDVLNSCKVKSVNKLRTAFRMSEDQIAILQEAQNMFANIKAINLNTGKCNTKKIKAFENFQITIQSILQLFNDLKQEGFKYIFTRRLNQESVENFFGSVKQQDGFSEPTPIQFTRAFSKLFITNMLRNSSLTNCETDIYKILLKAEDIMKTDITIPDEELQTSLVLLDGETDYRMIIPEINALTYVASYLIFKCTKKHYCVEMQSKLEPVPGLNQLFAHYKAYNKDASFYGGLKMPPEEVIQYVDKLETAFAQNFENCILDRPGSSIFKLFQEIPPTKLCSCFPIEYFLKLFVRLRIFDTVRKNNLCFRARSSQVTQYLKVKKLNIN